jgi:hypothetical protein
MLSYKQAQLQTSSSTDILSYRQAQLPISSATNMLRALIHTDKSGIVSVAELVEAIETIPSIKIILSVKPNPD